MRPILKKIPLTNLDYIEIYAEKLKTDKNLFKQQKMLIDSQIQSSREIFRKRFGEGKSFKINARKYLKSMGLI